MQRRTHAAVVLQRCLRGFTQRRRYAAMYAFYAIVNGTIDLRSSSGKAVPAYTLTVVRGGRCWQVWHRFSDWVELDRQVTKCLPADVRMPSLPSRYPFRSKGLATFRQFALNRYLQQLLLLIEDQPAARRITLDFLSRSHLHWLYAGSHVDAVPPTVPTMELLNNSMRRLERAERASAELPFADVRDGSTGRRGAQPPRLA